MTARTANYGRKISVMQNAYSSSSHKRMPHRVPPWCERIALAAALWCLWPVPAQAALAQSILTGACDTANNTVFTTALITPTSGALTLAAVTVTSETTATTVTGAGLTWTQVTGATITFDVDSRMQIFRGTGTPSTGVLTITAGGATAGACWKVFEFSGQHATTPSRKPSRVAGRAQRFAQPWPRLVARPIYTVWVVAFDDAAGTHTLKASYANIGGQGRATMSTPDYSLSGPPAH
jgi:hypothetical protein